MGQAGSSVWAGAAWGEQGRVGSQLGAQGGARGGVAASTLPWAKSAPNGEALEASC